MFLVVLIRTPTDFQQTMDCEDCVIHTWVTPLPEVEPDVRHVTEAIFNDLQYMSSDEPELVRSYLESIYEPLQALSAMGIQLVGVVTSGQFALPAGTLGSTEEKTLPWRRAHYIVAPTPAYYRLANEQPTHVHKLGLDCEGIRLFTRSDGEAVTIYGSLAAVERDFEGSVPWCESCGFEAVADAYEEENIDG